MEKGYLSLVLNAHLPFVRQPDFPDFLEERWFFEALTETYLPLLRMLKRLDHDNIPSRLTLVISPTLASMLSDDLLKKRYVSYLEMQLELAGKERERTAQDRLFGSLSRLYGELYRNAFNDFTVLHKKNILAAFDLYRKKGRIEIITTGATHSFLPLYRDCPTSVCAQVELALENHRTLFASASEGFWLPQLGWYPGLETILQNAGVRFTVVSARGALLANPGPKRGSYAPVNCADGFSAFVRDVESTNAVWSQGQGYPADPEYRDFYRDIGFDLPLEYIGPYIEDNEVRTYTGYKYWAVTGKTDQKRPYDAFAASQRALEHARFFIDDRIQQAQRVQPYLDRLPLMVCPYDAELFGHWWFEGPQWLESVFRIAHREGSLRFVTLSEYLDIYPENQLAIPEFSSWGDGGYADVWLNGANDWVYRHTYKLLDRMMELAERFPDESGLRERVLNQACREVLLAMCSDWSLMMRSGQANSFAHRQIEDSVGNFTRIYEMLCANTVETEWITRLEKRNNLLPLIDYRIFKKRDAKNP